MIGSFISMITTINISIAKSMRRLSCRDQFFNYGFSANRCIVVAIALFYWTTLICMKVKKLDECCSNNVKVAILWSTIFLELHYNWSAQSKDDSPTVYALEALEDSAWLHAARQNRPPNNIFSAKTAKIGLLIDFAGRVAALQRALAQSRSRERKRGRGGRREERGPNGGCWTALPHRLVGHLGSRLASRVLYYTCTRAQLPSQKHVCVHERYRYIAKNFRSISTRRSDNSQLSPPHKSRLS